MLRLFDSCFRVSENIVLEMRINEEVFESLIARIISKGVFTLTASSIRMSWPFFKLSYKS